MKVSSIVGLFVSMALGGCASIVNGVNQPVSVESRSEGMPVAGASCKMSSNKGVWFVTTPGTVTIHRGFQDLAVECSRDGYTPAIATVPSHVKAMAFGNLIFGGAIGVIVDSGDGAAFDYPELISIDLGPKVSAAAAGSVYGPPPAPPVAISSVEQPIANAPTSPVATRETRFQVSAEGVAKARACSASPVATLTASGPGSETYSIPCTSGPTLVVRCEFGNCRAIP